MERSCLYGFICFLLLIVYNLQDNMLAQNQNIKHSTIPAENIGIWTSEEENFIKNLRQVEGIKNWKQIAQRMSKYERTHPRTPKQCRERYMNFIRFDQDRELLKHWTQEEEKQLFNLYIEQGSRWVEISKQFTFKSENCLKNKFYGSIRKLTRKINSIGKKIKKLKKVMKYESILRPLDFFLQRDDLNSPEASFLADLKHRILNAARNGAEKLTHDQIGELIEDINRFNWATRCRNCTFRKKNSKERSLQKPSRSPLLSSLSISKMPSEYLIDDFENSQLEKSFNDICKKDQFNEEVKLIDMTLYQLEIPTQRNKQFWELNEDKNIAQLLS